MATNSKLSKSDHVGLYEIRLLGSLNQIGQHQNNLMKKERNHPLTLQLLDEYQKGAFQNASELIDEAEALLKKKHFARAYYLACASLEEAGKAFLAFLSKGRNLSDPGAQKKIRAHFEDHRSKILSSLGCLLQQTKKTKDEIDYFLSIAFALEVGRERAMYVDVTDDGTVILPRNDIKEINATNCVRLARDSLKATVEYVSISTPPKFSSFQDKMFCIRSEKLAKIMNSEDFSNYLSDFISNDSSGFDLAKALVKYHDEFFSKNKLYSPNQVNYSIR